ncbi:GyrI-like domain-containing protein, partial [candidate division FCPU426 bacterium]|nr:GyrI-like domain-containing protein [candidate division FCPU426 bacterium]
ARFVIPADMPKDRGERTAYFEKASLRGAVAIPVPAGTASLPDFKAGGKMPARLATWSYGEVAEILHIGPYDKELPAIDKLEQFIKDQGYMIVGEHEEEYLRGPGMPFSKPEKYYTIIRFRVKKAETP